uniref:Myeloid cell nuclear differentiation antigen n=1 Tax=Catagonus wagneri TaxID=51154 RepID=A0A8C3X2I8_9CETA
MTNEYKKIFLLKGLENIDDYHFSMIKSLLAQDLGLTRDMQDNYNRIKIADLMELKFPGVACVDMLEDLLSNMTKYQDLAKALREEKIKGNWESFLGTWESKKLNYFQKRKTSTLGETGTKRKKVSREQTQSASPSRSSTSTTTGFPPLPQTSSSASSSAHLPPNQKNWVLQKGPMTVMVLKATEPFEYESPEEGESTMFHATVVTASQFFQVKVFNTNLKEKFTKQKFITISDYSEYRGTLAINRASSVSEAGLDQKFKVPKHIIKRASETPKINSILKMAPGTIVYGLFVLHQKKVHRTNTIYEIQDNTGKMDVMGNGKWHNMNCEKGDKLRLYSFQLKTVKTLKLTCELHSLIQNKEKVNREVKGKMENV